MASGLLSTESDSVRVRHPLVRSAVYQAATGEQRRTAHQALADALAGLGDPDREAWHRAAAASGPDPEVAAALELAGSRAERRGGYVAAMAAYERAAALTEAPQRAALTFAAARTAWACGQAAAAQAMLSAARETAADPVLLSDIARLRGHIEVNIGSATDAHQIFIDAARAVRAADPLRALEIGRRRCDHAHLRGRQWRRSSLRRRSREALSGRPSSHPCLEHMLVAMTPRPRRDWSGAVAALDVGTGERRGGGRPRRHGEPRKRCPPAG